MGRANVIMGVRVGDGWTIGLTSYIQKGKQECDWFGLKESGEQFIWGIEYVGGFKLQWPTTFVSSVTPSADADGKNTLEIELVALKVKPL